MRRRFNPRRVKIHWVYSVSELADVIGVHRRTVRRWIAAKDLPTIDDRRQSLIRGADFRAFMQARRPQKQTCAPGEIYCLPCRSPQRPACDMAEYVAYSVTRGALRGFCPRCERLMYRAVTPSRVVEISGDLDVTYPRAEQSLVDSSARLSNVPLKRGRQT